MPHLKRLSITSLRNIQQVSLSFSPMINLFYGENGSGKTSVLEAVGLLGLGRSFRSHKIRAIITHDMSSLVVFAELLSEDTKITLGLQKTSNGRNDIKINHENAKSLSELAKILPLKIIDSSAFQLLEGSSQQRRQFLDWMVFHVKPEFVGLWQRANRALKQRNSLLRRDKIANSDLAPWDQELKQLSEAIDDCRKEVFDAFVQDLQSLSQVFFNDRALSISIDYDPGWDTEKGFEQELVDNLERDLRDGYSHKGPHRADLKIKVNGKLATDYLSRGQIKSLVCLLHIASARFFQERKSSRLLFLIDDLLAELDNNNAKKLIEHLCSLKTQLFVTGIEKTALVALFQDKEKNDLALFHVKQGEIKEEKAALSH